MWAAGHVVFGIEPHKLVEASEGVVTDLKRDNPSSAGELGVLLLRSLFGDSKHCADFTPRPTGLSSGSNGFNECIL